MLAFVWRVILVSLFLFFFHSSLITHHPSLALAQTPQERLLEHYNRGVDLANQGDFEKAEKEFKAALVAVPGYLPAHLSLGLVYEALGRPRAAISEYQSILRLNRTSEEARQAIRRMAQIGNTLESAQLIETLYNQVRARIGIGDLEGARQATEALLALAPENPGGFHFKGLLQEFMGQKEEATKSFERALEIEPGYVPSRYELGLLYEEAGRVEEAVREFQTLFSTAPRSPEAAGASRRLSQLGPTPEAARAIRDELSRGEAALKEGHLEEAQRSIEKVLQQLPQHVGAIHGQGLIHLRRGQLVEGERALARALEIDPSFARSRFLLGGLYELQGRPEDALKEYQVAQRVPDPVLAREATKRVNTLVGIINERNLADIRRGTERPRLARVRFSEGLGAMQREEYEKAIEEFKAAIEIDPTNPYFHFNMGLAHINLKQLVLAVLTFQKALELKPDHSLTLFWLGLTYQLSGDSGVNAGERVGASEEYRKALEMFEKSFRTHPEQWVIDEATNRIQVVKQTLGNIEEANGHIILASAFLDAKNSKDALREMALAAEILPRDPSILLSTGTIHEDEKNVGEAIASYQKAAEVNSSHPAPSINLGLLYQKIGRVEEAEKAFLKAVEVAPTQPEPRLRLGGFYFDQKRFDEAKTQYQKTIEIDPKNSEAHLFLAQVFDQEERTSEALKEYDVALTLLEPNSTPAKFIEDRKNALRSISGSWTHTFFSYDNNASSTTTNSQESIANSFLINVSYVALRLRRISHLFPFPLSFPIQFQSSNTSLLRQERFFNTDSVNLSPQILFLENYNLGTNYQFTFNYNDLDGPVALNNEWDVSLSRSGTLPRQIGVGAGLSRLDSLIQSGSSRSSYALFFNLNHSWEIKTYGSANLGYNFSNTQALEIDQLVRSHAFSFGYSKAPYGNANLGFTLSDNRVSARLDQSGTNKIFSLGYSRSFFGRLSFSAGGDYTLTTFDTPRIVPAQGGQAGSLVTTTETNNTYSYYVAASHPLSNGLIFSVSYTRRGNRSNLDVPRAGLDPAQELLAEQLQDRFRSLATYQKDLVSLSVSKSF